MHMRRLGQAVPNRRHHEIHRSYLLHENQPLWNGNHELVPLLAWLGPHD